MIKKRIFRYWFVNILMTLALFIAYRIVIAESEPAGSTWIEKFLFMLDVILNLGFSLFYLLVMIVASLAIFFNQIAKIRNNGYLSSLTFLAVPLVGVLILAVKVSIDVYTHSPNILSTVLTFSILYLLGNTITFLSFRKSMKKLQEATPQP
ncbi:hypothetical protein [Pedobacter chitinilyticus]|uniref:Uncharacterized protein n=1 Tax=Pedobacter chitinilyticus TaxID=2233776 RepID=A0A3S3SXF4_9SPHI|nr:hypothetical protein [Pedobacter chitinilyticus]RWU10829.1 hypothetical protein DPV69_05725 [Pedobacter chitinilyticus]